MNTNKFTTLVTLASLLASVDTLYAATDLACDKVCGPALTTAYLAITGLANDNDIHFDTVKEAAYKIMGAEARDASDAADAAIRPCSFGGVL
jgi:hypothetical protein